MDTSYQLLQQQLRTARQRFIDGEPLPDSLLPEAVARSWERSRQTGLLPWQPPSYQAAAPRSGPGQDEADRRLVAIVREEVEQLWHSFGGPAWSVFCANPQGVIVHAYRSATAQPRYLQAIRSGWHIHEAEIGTTAPSITLAEQVSIVVRGNQHYLSEFEALLCLAVPLRGLDGELIGVLDLTGHGDRDMPLLDGYFRQAAMAAENRLYAYLHHCHLLRIQHDPRWLDTPLQGLLAVTETGRIRAANRVARRLLGLPATGLLAPAEFAGIFQATPRAQLRRALQPGTAPRRLTLPDGTHVYTSLLRAPLPTLARRLAPHWRKALSGHAPAHPKTTAVPPRPAYDASLQTQLLDAVRQALEVHHGNIAAAARQLKLSRTTVYKKLAQLRGEPEPALAAPSGKGRPRH